MASKLTSIGVSLHNVDSVEARVLSRRGGCDLQRATRATSAAHTPPAPPTTHSAQNTDTAVGVVEDDGSRSNADTSLES